MMDIVATDRMIRAGNLNTVLKKDRRHHSQGLSIIWSCLVTIFACIWVAVHRDVPRPR
jgi:hypothetical protein